MKQLLFFIIAWFAIVGQAFAFAPTTVCSGDSSASVACTTVQAPTEDGASAGTVNVANTGGAKYRASKFVYTGTNGKAICKIDLWINFVGSSTHNYYAAIWGHDVGNNEPEIGDIQGTSDVQDLSGIGGAEAKTSFTLSIPTSGLTNGATYWVLLHSATSDGSNYAQWHIETDGATEESGYSGDGSDSSWTTATTGNTFKFELYSQ